MEATATDDAAAFAQDGPLLYERGRLKLVDSRESRFTVFSRGEQRQTSRWGGEGHESYLMLGGSHSVLSEAIRK